MEPDEVDHKSVSNVSTRSKKSTSSSSMRSASREIVNASILKSELLLRKEALEKKRQLDVLEEEIRWKKEMLAVETELAMSQAKINILETENRSASSSSTQSSKVRVEKWLKGQDDIDSRVLTKSQECQPGTTTQQSDSVPPNQQHDMSHMNEMSGTSHDRSNKAPSLAGEQNDNTTCSKQQQSDTDYHKRDNVTTQSRSSLQTAVKGHMDMATCSNQQRDMDYRHEPGNITLHDKSTRHPADRNTEGDELHDMNTVYPMYKNDMTSQRATSRQQTDSLYNQQYYVSYTHDNTICSKQQQSDTDYHKKDNVTTQSRSSLQTAVKGHMDMATCSNQQRDMDYRHEPGNITLHDKSTRHPAHRNTEGDELHDMNTVYPMYKNDMTSQRATSRQQTDSVYNQQYHVSYAHDPGVLMMQNRSTGHPVATNQRDDNTCSKQSDINNTYKLDNVMTQRVPTSHQGHGATCSEQRYDMYKNDVPVSQYESSRLTGQMDMATCGKQHYDKATHSKQYYNATCSDQQHGVKYTNESDVVTSGRTQTGDSLCEQQHGMNYMCDKDNFILQYRSNDHTVYKDQQYNMATSGSQQPQPRSSYPSGHTVSNGQFDMDQQYNMATSGGQQPQQRSSYPSGHTVSNGQFDIDQQYNMATSGGQQPQQRSSYPSGHTVSNGQFDTDAYKDQQYNMATSGGQQPQPRSSYPSGHTVSNGQFDMDQQYNMAACGKQLVQDRSSQFSRQAASPGQVDTATYCKQQCNIATCGNQSHDRGFTYEMQSSPNRNTVPAGQQHGMHDNQRLCDSNRMHKTVNVKSSKVPTGQQIGMNSQQCYVGNSYKPVHVATQHRLNRQTIPTGQHIDRAACSNQQCDMDYTYMYGTDSVTAPNRLDSSYSYRVPSGQHIDSGTCSNQHSMDYNTCTHEARKVPSCRIPTVQQHDHGSNNMHGWQQHNSDFNYQYGANNMPQDQHTSGQSMNMNNLAAVLIEKQLQSTLPQRQIKPYSGDPLEYSSFMQAFKFNVESKTRSGIERLYYLEQFTTGEPNTIVKGFLNRNTATAYDDARALLAKKFGNRFAIAEAFKTKAEKWTDIKQNDAQHWMSFSVFLHEYQNTLHDLNFNLDNSSSVKLLVDKLPYGVRKHWRMLADDAFQKEDRVIGFDDFVTFVDKQARVINHPVYGNIESTKQIQQGKRQSTDSRPRNRSSFATTTSTTGTREKATKGCDYCKTETHSMDVCRKLLKKPYPERISFMKKASLCYGCLKKASHYYRQCTNKLKCDKCKEQHPTVLHKESANNNQRTDGDRSKPTSTASNVESREQKSTFCGFTGAGAGSSQVVIVPVLVRSKVSGAVVKTNAMLDECSDAVFLTERLKKKLKIKGTKTKLTLQTIMGEKDVESQAITGLEVMDSNGENSIHLPRSYTCPSIPASTDHVPTNEDIKQWPYMNRINLPKIEGDVDILIGNNTPRAMEPLEIIHSEKDGPFACRTLLGWVIHGARTQDSNNSVGVYRIQVDKEMTQQLKDLYNMDFSERIIEDTPQRSAEDEQFLATVTDSIHHEDGHYVINLPLRDPDVKFTNNLPLAEQRLASLKRKMARNQEFKTDYTAFMTDMLNQGYAEEVPANELDTEDGKIWFLPHHGVYHPQKQKIRVVFDCAAMYHGVSLNNELLQGPDLSNTLLGVILRFRQEQVAVMADIKAMYHQVMVPEEDRNLLRFLWWPEGDVNDPVKQYRMKAHLFGARSSPSCANFALQQTAKDNEKLYSNDVIATLQDNFYVDDCLKSVPSEDKAIALAHDLKAVCANGGFNLVKWVSNRRRVIESIPAEDRAMEVKTLDFDTDLPTERALGILWSAETDTFGYRITMKDKPPTRRGILSVVSSVYDPLGFVSPAVLPAKKILQELCKLQISWDDKIPDMYERQWNMWLSSIPDIADFTIARCFVPEDFGRPASVQLHHFSDASITGYGTVSYLRVENLQHDVHCSLVMGKSKVAPLKQVSVPRLELTAATTAVRINHVLQKELDISVNDTFFWTDSQTVLQYINNNTARFKTFVANRIAVIRDGSHPSQWRYVETWQNPADYSSRGQPVDKFLKNEMWRHGPEFLWKPESAWPVTSLQDKSVEDDPEIKKVSCNATHVNEEYDDLHPQVPKNQVPEETIDKLFEHFSDWTRLKRAVAWWLRLKQILLNKSKQTTVTEERRSLTAQDLETAEDSIIMYVQKKSFPQELKLLQSMKDKDKVTEKHVKYMKKSVIANLDPEVHDDLLRVGGRLRNAPIPVQAKHQLILPKNHHVSKLIIRYTHEKLNHQGRNHIMAELRQRYWIVRANTEVKKIVKHCVTCRKYQASVCKQKMADLPASRLQPEEPAFTRTGVDYFGPLIIKAGRTTRKRYGVLFTCLTSRAVHLEVAENLDTSSFIAALRRFMARRGPVKELRSDNGSNFVGANTELKAAFKEIDEEQIQKYTSNHGINWIFNAPAASHHGGVWERQIRTVRKIMQSILQTQYLKTCQREEQLHTLLCEVECTINSRPLTRLSDDPNDLGVLTPNDILLLRPNTVESPGNFVQTDLYARRRWRQMQYCADTFWKRWLKEYIPDLQQRQKWLHPQRNLRPGDVVLIADDTAPRNAWIMGKVLQVFPDKSGYVRQAVVKTKSTVLRRPVDKLCMLLEADE